jgi:hypothetical protein
MYVCIYIYIYIYIYTPKMYDVLKVQSYTLVTILSNTAVTYVFLNIGDYRTVKLIVNNL